LDATVAVLIVLYGAVVGYCCEQAFDLLCEMSGVFNSIFWRGGVIRSNSSHFLVNELVKGIISYQTLIQG